MKNIATKHKVSREEKLKFLTGLQEKIHNTKCIILASYKGLTMSDLTQLRKELAQYKSKFQVVKNRFLEMSLQKLGLENLAKFIKGPTGIIFCDDDIRISETIKYIVNYSKEKPNLHISSGYIFNTVVDKEKIIEISKLPSKEVLLVQLVSLLNLQINRLYNVLNSPLTSFANILAQLKERK